MFIQMVKTTILMKKAICVFDKVTKHWPHSDLSWIMYQRGLTILLSLVRCVCRAECNWDYFLKQGNLRLSATCKARIRLERIRALELLDVKIFLGWAVNKRFICNICCFFRLRYPQHLPRLTLYREIHSDCPRSEDKNLSEVISRKYW